MFNKEQREAIEHVNGPMVVVAGPGSGKTTVVVNRTKRLIEKGIDPNNILVITFTKAAATEMETRYNALTNYDAKGVTFGTIHSIALSILVNSFNYSYDDVLSANEARNLIRNIIKKQQIYTEDINQLIKKLISAISLIKSGKLKPPYEIDCGCRSTQLVNVYDTYTKYCKDNHKIDYDDMQILCLNLLQENKNIRDYWQNKYQYIQVDEFQDVCDTQMDFIEILAAPNNNLMIVGDDDQSLYRFRGAKPEIMLNFENKMKGCKKVVLDTNYRSGTQIVSVASSFIKTNGVRFDKDFKSVNTGGNIQIQHFENDSIQAKKIVNEIRKLLKKKVPYDEIAVIYRTNSESSKIAGELMVKDIPFIAKSDSVINMFDHWIFKDIVNFYKISQDLSHASWNDIVRALKRPTRYIPVAAMKDCKSLNELKDWGYNNKKPYIAKNVRKFIEDMEILKTLSLSAFLAYLVNHMDYRKSVIDFADYNRYNPQELVSVLDEIIDSANDFNEFAEWYEYSKDYSFTMNQSIDETKEGVHLMTMHGSKGLEFEHVFIIDANEDITPYAYQGIIEDEEEERRMFYVAMTRAKQYLHISYVDFIRSKKTKKSRFVNDIENIMVKDKEKAS